MRLWLILFIALVAVTIVAAFSDVHEEDLEVAETRVRRGFMSKLKKGAKKVGKGASKHLKSLPKKVAKYAKKGLKKLFNEAKDWLVKELKNAFKTEGPICYNRACAFCLSFDAFEYKTKFCGGVEYDRNARTIKFALKHLPNGEEDMVFLYKKQISDVMKLPNCMTLPWIKQICIQGVEMQVPPITIGDSDTHKNAKACVVVVARQIGIGARMCMIFKDGKKKASFNLLTGEERDGALYTADAVTDKDGAVTGFQATKNLKTGDDVKDDDLPGDPKTS